MTLRDYMFILCSFHSIPLQSTLFVVFDGRKSARKNEAIFTHFGGQSAVTPFNKAIFSWIFCIPSLKQNQILFFVLTKIQRPFDNDDQQRVFIGFKFNKKMHFFPKWTRVLEAEIYEYEFIHSIGPTSCHVDVIAPFRKTFLLKNPSICDPFIYTHWFYCGNKCAMIDDGLKSVYMRMWLQFVHDFTRFYWNFW